MKIEIQIKNQQIITKKTRCIVANSVNFITGVCVFDEEWDGLVKHIIFTNGTVSKELGITQNVEFIVPYEVLVPGKLEISVVGYGENGEKRLTTKKMSMSLLVCESGAVAGSAAEKYTPEIWEQIAVAIGNISELAVDANTLVDAINAIVNAEETGGIVLQKDDSGFFQTTEKIDGVEIYYLHDKKNLEQSRNIIKLSDNMLEFSNDSGESYVYTLKINVDELPEILAKIENHTVNLVNPHNVTASQIGAVPEERKINGKALKEDILITAEEINAVPADRKINGKVLSGDIMLDADDFGAVPVSRKVNGKVLGEDITLTASDVGAEVSGTIQESIEKHNAEMSAHSDIRILVEQVAGDIKTLTNIETASSEELSERIENNRNLIDVISAEKLAVSDVVNDLATVDANKPLSAAQGVAIKRLIDGIGEHAENKENPHGVTIGQIGAAPNGYGLGEFALEAPIDNDANNAIKNGKYNMYASTANGTGEGGTLEVTCRSYGYAHQEFISDSTGCSAQRRQVADIWRPWEWINPPMVVGIEYRTTERYLGKPVYTRLVNCGNFPSVSSKTVSVGDWNITQVISCEGFGNNIGVSLPYSYIENGVMYPVVNAQATWNSIIINCSANYWTDYICYVILKYTKD